jgi:Rrf2 family transcriptional regulator, nitric oxide-sensitive transcriptional repressor
MGATRVRLLASTDIALRLLMLLAREPPGQHVSVDTLAQKLGGLSRHHLHKIVQDLTAMDITRTVRGAGGGVMLARPASRIRLGTLIRHLEEGQAVVECFKQGGCDCTFMPRCRLRGMLRDAQAGFYQGLDEHTLADCLAA